MAALLDMDQLRTFVAIADTGSFTRAADAVHKTQSAVSMQMKKLEERIGRAIFARDGRASRLTEDGLRLADYARRILRLNGEALASFTAMELAGHVRLGLPDDYADRYLPEILARFSESNPRVEVTVVCEPTPMLVSRIAAGDLDLAIITHVDAKGRASIIRTERLLWVTSARHGVHEATPVPLALGRLDCTWRQAATAELDDAGINYRVLYSSWNSTAVGAAVLAGLAVSVLPESALRPGMRVLGPSDGFPALPSCKIALLRNGFEPSRLADALAALIATSLDNLSGATGPEAAAAT
ncbi:LysR substrate-binding domain-containing protein [Lichenihabitans sp. Uapishka_5]|uniref:LysR substrate-binding domain-containing protein n=1 Tax=Lichenihabitans sp. Uapishka_5 TaxID=3037302 RepID=UPI0029E7CE8F|nr:LysR substrate-binding domain-containing protein [Lichenihabitans sp. Uapishka_5]MDX7951031.1 LysR substrate-binding domain-containing protein [Lichenihabitans sp. Uapishka_5]